MEINPSSLTIPELKKLWDRDKGKKKSKAYQEITYVYHMCDYNSEYSSYDLYHKEETIKKDHIKEEKWKPDKYVQAAMKKYLQLQETPALRALKAQEELIDKITITIRDIEQSDLKNSTVMDKTLSSSEKLNKLIIGMPKLKEAVAKEQMASDKIRGGGEVGLYEE